VACMHDREDKNVKILPLAGASIIGIVLAAATPAQTAGQDIKNAGHETKEAAKDAGKGTAKAAKTGARKTKNGVKKGAHATASGVEKGADKVEDKTR
jgi:predicted small secreted protein